jgi:hypothetical protein
MMPKYNVSETANVTFMNNATGKVVFEQKTTIVQSNFQTNKDEKKIIK